MSLPVDNTITMPSAVAPWPNGGLPDKVLVTAAGFNGGPDMVLCAVAMRAFTAYAGACHAATGVALRTTSKADSYRRYAIQEAVFRLRYTSAGPTAIDRVGVNWPGHGRWYHESGAQAAVPGTSNHGMAIAVDWANYAAVLEWMKANAAAYGISWELQSEAWHQRYNDGDNLPAAVLAWEQRTGDDMPKAIHLPDGYWLAIGGKRERILDADDMAKVRQLYGAAVCFPGADVNGFPDPTLTPANGWTIDEVDRLIGRPPAPATPPASGNPVPGNYVVTGTLELAPPDE